MAANQFQKWVGQNEHVIDALTRLALQTQARGHQRYSIYALYNVLRWQTSVAENGDSGFKLSNNYQPGVARIIMEREPRLQGFFVTRRQWNKDFIPEA